jgi:predicted outer membrane repeat protein
MSRFFNRSDVSKRKGSRTANRPAHGHKPRRAGLEWLEPRLLLSIYQPNTFTDGLTANTLRGAIIAANARGGENTIILRSGTYTLTIANDLTIDNGIENKCLRGDLDVTSTLTIQGAGPGKTIIDAAQLDRVFQNFATLTLKNLTVTGGSATNQYEAGGGGILSSAELVLQNCYVLDNVTTDSFYHTREGGGIYTSAPLTITDSIISGNLAENGYGNGGGIRSTYSSTANTNTISGSVIEGNSGNGGGMSISGLWEIDECLFSGNISSGQGGAILGSAAVTRSTFSYNSAVVGGAISGGGTVTNCTFEGNQASGLTGVTSGGGAIYGAVGILDSTFTANTAPNGGAIFGYGSIDGCTFSGNTATAYGGALYANGTLTLKNTIVAVDTATSGGPDVYGTFVSQGHNLIGDGTGSTGFVDGVLGDMVGTTVTPIDPLLGALQDNGGPTETMALLALSPAIDAGDNTGAPATDQRGVIRILDGGGGVPIIDIGAFEYDPAVNPVPVIAGVTVKEVADPAAVTLLSTQNLVVSWSVTTGLALTSHTLTIDGKAYTPVLTEGSTTDYFSQIGQWVAGDHYYVIEATNIHGASRTSTGMFTVVNPPPPAITDVVVAEAQTPTNGSLESNENLKITWKATCDVAIASQSLTVDGVDMSAAINGPYENLYYSCQIEKWAAGIHSYTITSTDSLGDSTVYAGTFTVVAPVTPPAITSVVVAESRPPRSGSFTPNEPLVITWSATCSLPITSQTVTVDGLNMVPINGPYSGQYYSCQIGTWAVGSHSYTITSTDSLGDSSTSSGTFTVVAVAPPTISSVVVAEAQTPKNAVLESNENLKITWSATSTIAIVSQTLTVDGQAMGTINGPYSGQYYSCLIYKWAVGGHYYTITSTDSLGNSSVKNGTFNVVAPIPPTVGSVVVAEAGTTRNGTLEAGEPLKITWAASSQHGIAAQTVTIDGRVKTPIKGPYSGLYYSCAIGSYAAGTHTYKIKSTDSKGVSSTVTGPFVVAIPLTVGASAAPQGKVSSLTNPQLAAIVAEATSRWVAQLGSEAATTLAGVKFQVADLWGRTLGETLGKTVWIDRNAAGYGWFVDSTPQDDAEFVAAGTSLSARKNSAAAQRADLLTVVMHEMGHLLGYADAVANDLMGAMLPLGTRRVPGNSA